MGILELMLLLASLLLGSLPPRADGQFRPLYTTASPISFSFSIEEELPVGYVVGQVLLDNIFGSSQSHRAGNVKFGVFKENPRTDYFHVVPSNGTIVINRTIDRDSLCFSNDNDAASCFIDLPIRIVLNGTLHNIQVRIFIVDRNDNVPSWTETTNVHATFKEGPRSNNRFEIDNLHRLPLAVDRDAGNNSIVRYALVGDNDTMNTFELLYRVNEKPKGLYLRPVKELNRETRDNYDIQLEAIDGGGQKGRLLVKVTVQDINDNAPRFVDDTFNFTLPENAAIDDLIVTLQATDPDSGPAGEVEYSVTHRYCTPNVVPFPFNVSPASGRLYVQHALDFETTRQCGMTVTARDHGDPPQSSSVHVLIHIQDVNDEAPTISVTNVDLQAQLSVPENNVTERLGWLFVSDKDTVNGVLQCHAASNSDDVIALESTKNYDTFSIRLRKAFDREVQPIVNVTVECTDNGYPPQTATSLLSIKITDVNDCHPAFQQQTFVADIYENEPPLTFVTTVRASDRDEAENGTITYRIAEESTSIENRVYFHMSASNGSIFSVIPFDREVRRRFTFRVIATDNGSPKRLSSTATVEVNIIDRNDNPPLFREQIYRFKVDEEQHAGVEVGRVEAIDADVGGNARVSYRLEDGEHRFSINERGEISTGRVALDREQVDAVPVVVFAYDHGSPSLTSTTTVLIDILDKNDNKPIFRPSYNNETSYFHFADCRVGSSLTSVTATDFDQNENGVIVYRLLSVSQSKRNSSQSLFTVDSARGLISVTQDLTENDCGFYKLVVEACDSGIPKLCELTVLSIVIDRSARSTMHANMGPYGSEDRSGSSVLNSVLNLFGLNEGRNVILVIVLSCVAGVLALILLATILYVRKKELAAQRDSHDDYDDDSSCTNAKNSTGSSPNGGDRRDAQTDGRTGGAFPQTRNGNRHAHNIFITSTNTRANATGEKYAPRETWPCRLLSERQEDAGYTCNNKKDSNSTLHTTMRYATLGAASDVDADADADADAEVDVDSDLDTTMRWQPGTFRRNWQVTKTRTLPNFVGDTAAGANRSLRSKVSPFQRVMEESCEAHAVQSPIPYSSVRQSEQGGAEATASSMQSCSDYVPTRGKRKDMVVSWFARCSPVDEDFERGETPRRSDVAVAYRHLLPTSPLSRVERVTSTQRESAAVYVDCRSFGADSGICDEPMPIMTTSAAKFATATWECGQARPTQESVASSDMNVNTLLPAPILSNSIESPATC